MKQRSGLIPVYFSRDYIFVCMMVPSDEKYGGKYPQFAKGIIDPGYTPSQNAIKEAKEELGINEKSLKKVNFLYYDVLLYIHWFYSECYDMNLDKPHYESLYSFWVEIEQAKRIIRPSQKPLLFMLEKIIIIE